VSRVVELGIALRFKGKHLERVLRGEKRVTIRLGLVRPKYGLVYITNGRFVYGEALVEGVSLCRISDLDDRIALEEGFSSVEELKRELQELYPKATENDYVTVIKFTVLRKYEKPLPLSEVVKRRHGV